ncbi:Gfo/Idh/MocA family oxidoreductase [Paenibacillus sp. P96]|uniref:Gfo/Idh/MocA family oxidoreductase n=1 Tax=Paenibacillus zeirhizosphaerae TaxID=2987519 RepID=A0ABT9FQ49_9BACL|nr:Gfo/Idh/MocA family oxidoreductase [Paenibacillus sp. P96]MDP4096789.1 Gfo/Idh/MocA family oxidoreductase [Paenibacillus sp. P96]
MNEMEKIKIAVAGLGDIARKVYLPLLSAHEGVEVIGIHNRSLEPVQQMLRKYRFKQGTTDLKELLGWGPDAVFIHSATEAHFDMVMQCIEQGVAVYVDKPLSYDLREATEMAAFAEAQGVLLGVGFNRRFAPQYVQAKAWLEEVGGIRQCAAVKHRTGLQQRPAKETVYDDLIHMLDLLLWLGGDHYELLQASVDQDEEGRLTRAFGALRLGVAAGMFSMDRQAGVDFERLELHGHGRSAEVTQMEQAVLYEKGRRPQASGFGSWDTILHRRGFTGAVNHFLDNIHTPEQCSIRAGLALESHILAERLLG